jgi:transketolase
MAESGHGGTLVRLGLRDTFAHGASRPYLARHFGMDALALVQAVGRLMDRELQVTEADLQEVRLDSVHSNAKAEAL